MHDFDEGEVRKWKAYDAVLEPEFGLHNGGDWSTLKAMLEEDLGGTLRALAELKLGTSMDVVSLPVYLGEYLSGQKFEEAAKSVELLSEDDYLFNSAAEELLVAISDEEERLAEIQDFVEKAPDSAVVQSGARLLGVRLAELYGGQEQALEFGLGLAAGKTRGMVVEGALSGWIDHEPEKAEAFLREHSSGDFDFARSRVASSYVSRGEIQRGYELAVSLPESGDRGASLSEAFDAWFESDAEGLKEFVEQRGESFDRQVRYEFEMAEQKAREEKGLIE
ncbi:MAG: hypothetical protein AAGC74_12855 [Verrucomicrobiota bacterium]